MHGGSNSQHSKIASTGRAQLWCCVLVSALFAPVFLSVGLPALRPAWLLVHIAGVPASVLWLVGLIIVFILLTGVFSVWAFQRDEP